MMMMMVVVMMIVRLCKLNAQDPHEKFMFHILYGKLPVIFSKYSLL
jgi:hypothetical protein